MGCRATSKLPHAIHMKFCQWRSDANSNVATKISRTRNRQLIRRSIITNADVTAIRIEREVLGTRAFFPGLDEAGAIAGIINADTQTLGGISGGEEELRIGGATACPGHGQGTGRTGITHPDIAIIQHLECASTGARAKNFCEF